MVEKFEFKPVSELSIPGDREFAASELRTAADMIEDRNCPDGCASWRAVDALVMLKGLNPDQTLAGIDCGTGMGGKLTINGRRP